MEWSEIDNGLLDPKFYLGTGYHAAFTQLRNEDPVRWVRDERYGKDHWNVQDGVDSSRA
jgi:cholest-4-en-3-one 26-monooxygenase